MCNVLLKHLSKITSENFGKLFKTHWTEKKWAVSVRLSWEACWNPGGSKAEFLLYTPGSFQPFQPALVYYSFLVYKLQRDLTKIITHKKAQCILRWIISFLQSYEKAGVAHDLVSFDISVLSAQWGCSVVQSDQHRPNYLLASPALGSIVGFSAAVMPYIWFCCLESANFDLQEHWELL